jgi:hypothetical protein
MELSLTQEVPNNVIQNGCSDQITDFSDSLADTVKDSNYSIAVQALYIGVICVAPEFEFLFKIRKPKYYKKKIILQDGRPYELIKMLTFDVKLDYEQVIQADKNQLNAILTNAIITSLNNLDVINLEDFNKNKLISDLLNLLDKLRSN